MKGNPSENAAEAFHATTSFRKISAEVYFQSHCSLGECPVWNNGVLYWTDISGKSLFAKPDYSPTKRYELGFEVGSFALWKNDTLVVAGERGFQSYNLTTGVLEPWTNPGEKSTNTRFNDGKCDPAGRFVAGTLSRSGLPEAALYVLDSDKSARELYRPVTCSNGLAWSADGKIFYYIDTPTGVVRAFNYDLEHGRLSNERVVIEIPKTHGRPDGMSIDCNGHLWIALWKGWGVECWNPETGKQLARIEIPTALVTSCAFGGDHYETLFITTARQGLDLKALAEQELAGSIFCAQPGVAGYPTTHFKNANEAKGKCL